MSLLRIGLILKGVDALFEIVGGALLFYPRDFNRWVSLIFQHDLIRRHADPQTVANIQDHAAKAIYGASIGSALYLIAHGLMKIIFIAAVMKEKKWGYVGLIAVLIIFTGVELWRSIADQGVAMFFFGLFDAYLAYLVWHEYRRTKKRVGCLASATGDLV